MIVTLQCLSATNPTAARRKDYTRAIIQGAELWSAVMAAGRAQQGLEERIRAYADTIDLLRRHRPEDLGDLVNMGNGVSIELGLLADLLSSMVGTPRK